MRNLVAVIAVFTLPSVLFAEDDAPKETPEAKTWVTEQSARVGGRNIDYTVTVRNAPLLPMRAGRTMAPMNASTTNSASLMKSTW